MKNLLLLFPIVIISLFTIDEAFAAKSDIEMNITVTPSEPILNEPVTVTCTFADPTYNDIYQIKIKVEIPKNKYSPTGTVEFIAPEKFKVVCYHTPLAGGPDLFGHKKFFSLLKEVEPINITPIYNYDVKETFNVETNDIKIEWDLGENPHRTDCYLRTVFFNSNPNSVENSSFLGIETNIHYEMINLRVLLENPDMKIDCKGELEFNLTDLGPLADRENGYLFTFFEKIRPEYIHAYDVENISKIIFKEYLMSYEHQHYVTNHIYSLVNCINFQLHVFVETTHVRYNDNELLQSESFTRKQCYAERAGESLPDSTPEPKKKSGGSSYNPPPTLGVDKDNKRLVDGGFSYNGNTVNAEYYHTEYPLITTQVGKKNTVELLVYENGGINNLKWVQLALGVPEIGVPLSESEVIGQLILSNGIFEEFNITDEQNLIQNFNATSIEPHKCKDDSNNEACLKITLEYEYREAPLHNIVAVNLMDIQRGSWTFTFNDGVEVTGESLNPNPTDSIHHKQGNQYPMITYNLERTDKVNDIWTDQNGIEYYKVSDNRYDRITPLDPLQCNDPLLDEMMNGGDRNNCNFRNMTDLWK